MKKEAIIKGFIEELYPNSSIVFVKDEDEISITIYGDSEEEEKEKENVRPDVRFL